MSDSRFVELIRQMRIGVSSEAAAELFTMLDLQFFCDLGVRCDGVQVWTWQRGTFWRLWLLRFCFFLYEINIIVETLFQTFHDVSFQDNSSWSNRCSNAIKCPYSLKSRRTRTTMAMWMTMNFCVMFFQTSFSDQIHQTSNGNHFEDEFVLRFLFLSFGPQLSCGCCRVAGKSGTDGLGDECSQC